jgi:hypothetical protein
MTQASQVVPRRTSPLGLPDSSFIMSNLPAKRPVAPPTATERGQAALGKGQAKASTAKKAKKTKKQDEGKA